MKKKRFSVEQIVGVLKQAEVGVPVAELIRKAGISEQTFYRWKKQYVGLESDQVREMKQLQDENNRLKQLVPELSLDKTMLQDVLVDNLCDQYRASERHACRVLRIGRGRYRYHSHRNEWPELRARIREIAQSRVRYGYQKILALLRREGWQVGKHLIYRLYKEEGLALKKRRPKRRKAVKHRDERFLANGPNEAWSIDFVADQLQDGRRFRALTIVDVFTRESIGIEVGQSLRGEDVVRTLNRLKHEGRTPKLLFCDNGSEFAGQAMDLWATRTE